jgi:orotidine-5'-phosphate decarboxylase
MTTATEAVLKRNPLIDAAVDPVAPIDRLIVALDYPSADSALELVDELAGACRWFKVGMELYYAAGSLILERLLERDLKVFLDLKLHDIPNTVAGAVRSIGRTGASLLTIHAGGGERMMQAASEAATSPGAPELLAVTVLTSMDAAELAGVGVTDDPGFCNVVELQVLRLARLARAAGIRGLVCSAEEVESVRQVMGPGARLVVPGIRPRVGKTKDDQRRTATPAEAIARGASMLVVGRPITRAPDRRAAAESILAEIQAGG